MAAQASAPISARARAATSSGSTDFVVWETRVMLTPLLRRWHRSSPGCRWTTHGTGALHLAANAEPRNPGHFVRWKCRGHQALRLRGLARAPLELGQHPLGDVGGLARREHADQHGGDVLGGVGRLEAIAILALVLERLVELLLQLDVGGLHLRVGRGLALDVIAGRLEHRAVPIDRFRRGPVEALLVGELRAPALDLRQVVEDSEQARHPGLVENIGAVAPFAAEAFALA